MNTNESITREHQDFLNKVRQLEPEFLTLRASLTTQQQTLLDSYIASCEALTEAELRLEQLEE